VGEKREIEDSSQRSDFLEFFEVYYGPPLSLSVQHHSSNMIQFNVVVGEVV
jgi:hypothetical protein